jgi:hypothetical protein
VERENAFFKSSPVDKYHLPQMNSEEDIFECSITHITGVSVRNATSSKKFTEILSPFQDGCVATSIIKLDTYFNFTASLRKSLLFIFNTRSPVNFVDSVHKYFIERRKIDFFFNFKGNSPLFT